MNLRSTKYVLALVLVALVLSGCGGAPATPTSTPKSASPTVPPPPPTIASTAAAPATPTIVLTAPTGVPPTSAPATATPPPAQVTAKQQVNVRQGPSDSFPVVGKMPNKTTANILAKSEDGKWFQIAFPEGGTPSWVSVAFVSVTGPIDRLPVIAVAPPPTPTAASAVSKTRAPTAVPVAAVPPAKGVIGFVSQDPAQGSFVLNNVVIDGRNISGFKLLGPVPADLAFFTNAAPFAWTRDNSGRAAWVYGSPGATTKVGTNILRVSDRQGNNRDIVSHPGISSPTWSPDGRTVAYIGMDNNFGTQFIYTVNVEGGLEQRLFAARTDRPENFRGVAWGKTHLLFVSNYTGSDEIWRLNSDGSGAFQLTDDRRENGSPAWSPDGTRFAYYSKQTDGSYQIMTRNADGTGARKMTNAGNNFTPTWSPDGNWIAFASTRGGRLDVYIMDKNGNAVQVLTDKFVESQLPGSWR